MTGEEKRGSREEVEKNCKEGVTIRRWEIWGKGSEKRGPVGSQAAIERLSR